MGLITFWAHQTPEQWCPRSMGHHQGTGPEKSFCSCKSSRFSNIFHCHVGSKNRSYVAIRDVTPFWRGIFGPYAYGSIPIHTIFRGMNIHLPAILMFTRGIGFWPIPIYQHHESKALFMDRQSMLPDQTRVTMDQRELVTKENQNWWRSNYFFLWNKAVWISRFPQFEMWAWVKLEQHPNPKKCILLVQIFQSSGLPNVNLYLQ